MSPPLRRLELSATPLHFKQTWADRRYGAEKSRAWPRHRIASCNARPVASGLALIRSRVKRIRHKRPPPRKAGPLHIFRFASLRSPLTAPVPSARKAPVVGGLDVFRRARCRWPEQEAEAFSAQKVDRDDFSLRYSKAGPCSPRSGGNSRPPWHSSRRPVSFTPWRLLSRK